MTIVQRWVAPDFRGDAVSAFQAEFSATVAVCSGVTVYEEPDPDAHPGEDLLALLFDGAAPSDVAIDDAIAAFPRTAPNITSPLMVSANAPDRVTIVNLAPGDHVSLQVYAHVSLVVGPSDTRDEALLGLAPIWRETDGTVRWSAVQSVSSGQVRGFSVDLVAAELDAQTVGVQLQMQTRRGGELHVVGVQVTELARRNLDV